MPLASSVEGIVRQRYAAFHAGISGRDVGCAPDQRHGCSPYLQQAGMIKYARGKSRIINLEGLQEASWRIRNRRRRVKPGGTLEASYFGNKARGRVKKLAALQESTPAGMKSTPGCGGTLPHHRLYGEIPGAYRFAPAREWESEIGGKVCGHPPRLRLLSHQRSIVLQHRTGSPEALVHEASRSHALAWAHQREAPLNA